MRSWYETVPLGAVTSIAAPWDRTKTTTKVVADIPGTGARCICYEGMAREDIAPSGRARVYEALLGTSRYLCSCLNKSPGATQTLDEISAVIQTDEFKSFAAEAVAAELGVRKVTSFQRTEEVEAKHRISILALGIGGVVLGTGLGFLLYTKARKSEGRA